MMHLVDLVTLLALIQFFVFGVLVGRARGLYGVKAPAVAGHEMFERAHRVQMNTLEVLVILVPVLYLSARQWNPTYSAIAGAIYLVGRIVYWRAYMADPGRRTVGFALSMGPVLVLLLVALFGAIKGLG